MADEITKDNLKDAVASVLRKARGNPRTALSKLLDENYGLREDRRRARDELKTYKEKYPEGTPVLTAEQTKVLDSLKEKGIDSAEKLTKELGKIDELQGKLKENDLNAMVKEASEMLEFPEGTLRDLMKARDLTLKVEDQTATVDEDGKKVKKQIRVAMLSKQGETPMAADEFIRAHAMEYEALLGSAEGETTESRNTDTTRRRVPSQSTSTKKRSSDSAGVSSIVEEILNANKKAAEAPNPLRSKVIATT